MQKKCYSVYVKKYMFEGDFMGGKRYDEEPKLNKKKVFSVILGIVVIIMFVLTLSKLLQDGDKFKEKANEETPKYFSVYTNDKWGIIDQNGKYVINPTYTEMIVIPDEDTASFQCVYDVNYQDGTYKTKIINQKNENIYTEYDDAEFMINYDSANVLWYEKNVVKVKKDGKYGMVNTKGRELLACEYDNIEPLKGVENVFAIKENNLVGLSDNFGNIIVDTKYKDIKPLVEGNKKEFIIINEEGKQGIALSDKTVSLECKYDEIKNVTANNAYVVKQNGKWQIIDKDNSINIETGFEDVTEMSNKYIIVKNKNKYGVIDTKGAEVIKSEYDELSYSFGEYFVAKKDNKYGIINSAGETKLDFTYDSLKYRKDADLFVGEVGENEPKIIDKEFTERLTGIISKVDSEKGYIQIRTNGENKYYNFKLEEKNNTEIFPNNTIFLSKKDGKYGYINKQGEVVVDYIYDEAKEQNEYGYASVNKNGKWGAIDQSGKVVQEPMYELKNNIVVDFIGKWHLAEDINANYYTDAK